MKLNIEDLRRLIKEEFNNRAILEEPLEEGIMDNKYPFKSIFVFGPAGAGKSFISGQVGIPDDFKTSNPDIDIEAGFVDFGLSMKFASKEELNTFLQQQSFREKMQQGMRKKTANWLNTASPVVFDTTGEDVGKMSARIKELAKAGYDVAVMQINVPQEISVQRDKERARTVGEPVAAISQQYQDQVAKDRGYFKALSGQPGVTMLADDIYANLFDLRSNTPLDGITDDMLKAMKTKEGKPYTPEYARALLDEIRGNLSKFLTSEPQNPRGKTLYAGMKALIKATGGKAGNMLTDFASVAQDEEIMAVPAIKAAAESIAELGGAREMFVKAQRGAKVAGQKLGTAVASDDGMRAASAAELGTKRSKIPFEVWRKQAITTIKGRDDLSDEEKKKRISKLATLSKADRYTDGPKLTKEQKLHNAIREIVKEILFTKGK